MDQFKLDLYEDEVFVFTPKGDLFKLGKGSTVLDFAFHIHSKLGCKCIGAKVNGKNAQLKQILNSGDQVEIMTSNTQTPKQDWLNISPLPRRAPRYGRRSRKWLPASMPLPRRHWNVSSRTGK